MCHRSSIWCATLLVLTLNCDKGGAHKLRYLMLYILACFKESQWRILCAIVQDAFHVMDQRTELTEMLFNVD